MKSVTSVALRCAAFALVALVTHSASGQARANPAAAEVLFQEGRRLLKEGKIDQACPKFDESQRLDPLSGTLLNLADCHERQGKTASAWAEFLTASRLAYNQGNTTRGDEAKRRASLLQPKLSYLTIVVAKGGVAGLTIKRNDEELKAAQFGEKVPTDPGPDVISAEAPGYEPFRRSVVVKAGGDALQIDIPQLAHEPPRLAPTPPRAPMPHAIEAAPSRSALGYVAGGLGVAALGVGVTFGLMAASSYEKAEDACPKRVGCSPDAIDARERAGTQAWVANAGIGVGLASLALGGYLLFLAPSRKPSPPARAGLTLVPVPQGLGLRGRF